MSIDALQLLNKVSCIHSLNNGLLIYRKYNKLLLVFLGLLKLATKS